MPTIKRFEDLEIWQMAREQANVLWKIYCEGTFAKDYEIGRASCRERVCMLV